MAGRNCAWYGKAVFFMLAATLGVRTASLVLFCIYAVPGDMSIMVATIPNGMELTVLAWIAGIALIVCVGTFIWRYAEYNAAKGETRLSNRISPKFIGAVILALAASIYFAYFLASPLVDILRVADPNVADYVTTGGLAAVVASIGFVVLFTEGINGFAKFISQGVRDVRANAAQLLEELETAKKEIAELKNKTDDDPATKD